MCGSVGRNAPPLLTTAWLAWVTQKIFDSVRRKFVRASVGVGESNLADVSQKAFSYKRFTSRDTSNTQATKSQLVGFCR